jgi:FkbM family methyltransferase
MKYVDTILEDARIRTQYDLNYFKTHLEHKFDNCGIPFEELVKQAYAQNFQDLFALLHYDFKQNGYFVEFGAGDGVRISNTYLLEKLYNWSGILAEPNRYFHRQLNEHRSVNICTDAVWNKSGEVLSFYEVLTNPVLSSLELYKDSHSFIGNLNEYGTTYNVNTISLNNLLEKYNAPYEIDFMSIDVEGAELEILQGFDFSKHKVKLVVVEYTKNSRNEIYSLLTSNNYVRINEDVTVHLTSSPDDWYVLKENNNT